MKTDYDGKPIKNYMEFECCDALTVKELRARLDAYPDDAIIYMEASNAYSHGDTWFAQKALDTYSCKNWEQKKALMIVGNMQ